MKSLLASTFVLVSSLALAACGSSSSGGDSTTTGGQGGGGGAGGSTASGALCDSDPRGEPYAVGLSQEGASKTLEVSFVDADPAPPTRGNNTWKVKVTDASGAALTGATIAVSTWMPDHNHGASVIPDVTETSEAGVYEITPLDLFMPGIWQITLKVTPAGGTAATDSVVFSFCVDG